MDDSQHERATLARIAAGYTDARLVVLFGSVARGNALPTSDVDVGVAGCPFWRALELGAAIGDALHREPHVVDLDAASDVLRYEVAKDGVLLHEAVPHGWVRFKAAAIVSYLDLKPIIDLCAAGVRERLRREARHG